MTLEFILNCCILQIPVNVCYMYAFDFLKCFYASISLNYYFYIFLLVDQENVKST